MVYNQEVQAQLGKWTHEDRERLYALVLMSDTFEPSLGMNGGLIEMFCVTPEQKEEENKRVLAIFKLRDAIREWMNANPVRS